MNFLAAFRKKREETDADLSKEYQTILRNHDQPGSDDDAERLVELVDQLGIDPEHVELHVIALAEHDRLLKESSSIDKLEKECSSIKAEQEANERKYTEESEPAIKSHRELAAELEEQQVAAKGSLQNAEARRDQAASIAGQFPEVFGESSNSNNSRPFWQPSTPAIAEVQERLGISRKASDHE